MEASPEPAAMAESEPTTPPEPTTPSTEKPETEKKDDENKKTDDKNDSSSSDGGSDDETSLASEFDVSNNDDDSSDNDGKDADTILIEATTAKEAGNNLFKAGDLKKACREYRKGVRILKPLNRSNTGDEQVKALLVSLYNNLSMLSLKLDKTKMSRDFATQSLKILRVEINPASPTQPASTGIDATVTANIVKSLYRRAVAHKKLGDIELAKNDLRLACKYDPNNNPVKKELLAIKKQAEQSKAKQKKGLAKAFSSSGGSLLYNDKEEELKKKKELEKIKQKQKQEEKEKQKKIWEDECVKRMAAGQEAISFDDWEKEQEKERKRQKKEEEKRKKEEQKAREEARRKQRELDRKNSKDETENSDDELTAKELAELRGYKKTSDGRTTSYFNRELSEQEKALIGNIAPQRLGAGPAPLSTASSSLEHGLQPQDSTSPVSAADTPPGVGAKGRPSAWNTAGTWEEKDTTEWCTAQLKSRLKETMVKHKTLLCLVDAVEDMTGDASVAIAAGKKKYIFDYHCSVKFEIQGAEDDEDDVVATGKLQIPDICSTHHEELEINFTGWKQKPKSARLGDATECQKALMNEIRVSVKKWVDDFNHHY